MMQRRNFLNSSFFLFISPVNGIDFEEIIKKQLMNKIIIPAFCIFLFIAGCVATRDSANSGHISAKEKKGLERIAIGKSIESRHYVLKMDRIILANGQMIDLVPRNNFIIINGEIISVSLAYEGRSFGIRRITGINFNGHISRYIMKSNEQKNMYNIQIEAVTSSNDKFDIYLTLSISGNCTASINNSYIQIVNYRGIVTPLNEVRATSSSRVPVR